MERTHPGQDRVLCCGTGFASGEDAMEAGQLLAEYAEECAAYL